LIYEGGTGANKNLEKLIKAMSLLSEEWSKIRLYIIGDELLRDLQLREYIVHYKAAGLIDVMGDIHYKKKAYFYHHAKGIILPSLYESFPFSLWNAVWMNKNILGSNIPAIKNVFWDKIRYFNPLSVNQIRQQLLELQNSSNEIDYRDITEKYTPEISAKVLLHEINN
jgi:glycosyltransferase involved in cell wall biosynthesis